MRAPLRPHLVPVFLHDGPHHLGAAHELGAQHGVGDAAQRGLELLEGGGVFEPSELNAIHDRLLSQIMRPDDQIDVRRPELFERLSKASAIKVPATRPKAGDNASISHAEWHPCYQQKGKLTC